MSRKFSLLTLVFALLTLLSSPAHAAIDSRGWAGALFGLTVPTADDVSERTMFGITAGAKLGSEWGLGGYFMSSAKNEDAPIGKFDFRMYGVQLAYHFEGEAAGAFIGGRLGVTKYNFGPGSDPSTTHFGPVLGYDYMFGDHLSLGGEVSAMHVAEKSGVDSHALLSFLGAAKFWF